ncbi:hypothetical protein HBB16_09570 [Pseudonocardia sp. MCCB 268]|nr:hypothetical protein [Pseudonocardia cytotoxica]
MRMENRIVGLDEKLDRAEQAPALPRRDRPCSSPAGQPFAQADELVGTRSGEIDDSWPPSRGPAEQDAGEERTARTGVRAASTAGFTTRRAITLRTRRRGRRT